MEKYPRVIAYFYQSRDTAFIYKDSNLISEMKIITNESAVDKWSIGHILIGVAFGLLNLTFLIALIITILWELFEIPLERRWARGSWLTKHPESNRNRLADILFNMIGWCIGIWIFSVVWTL